MDTTIKHLQPTLLDAALSYAARGWHVFPCHTPTGSSGCSCRSPICANPGKHPRTQHGLHEATTAEATIRRWWRQWPDANIAIATGAISGLVVLDIDLNKGGDTGLARLEQSYCTLPETVQQLTGIGGHYIFAHPGRPVKNSVETLGPGLDIRGDGGYIIAPPSLHATGRLYAWEVTHQPEDTPLASCPDWLLALLATTPDSKGPTINASAPILAGHRDSTLFTMGCSLRARGCSYEVILAALQTMNATQCDPPLPDDEVRKKAVQASKYAPGTRSQNGLQPPPSTVSTAALQPWRELLLTKKNGDPTGNIGNIGLILANHPTWAGRFWWDAVRGIAMLDTAPFTDELITTLAQWLHTQERLALSTTRPLRDCLMVECHNHPRDLLQLWLNGLPPWDGVARLPAWMGDVAGVTQDLYGQAVSRLLPLSMVARAMQPGCLYRYVVILEGPENTGKSSLVHALASSEWCVDLAQALESKESHMIIQGAWLAELPELDSLSRTEDSRLKAFITLQEDKWIPKYSNYPVTVPRRTIFVGTTNDHGYLKGQTGNTRYLPIQTHEIAVDMLLAMRDQLFAEALHEYQRVGSQWWRLPDDVLTEANQQREQRRIVSVYESDLDEWLEERRFTEYYGDGPAVYSPMRNEVSWQDLAQWYLKIDREKWKDISLQKQIATSLKVLGWEQRVVWRQSKAVRMWLKGLSAFDV